MITLRNLEKFYEHGVSKTFVLRQISLEVKEGEFLSIMGPSGRRQIDAAAHPSGCTTAPGPASSSTSATPCTR